MPIQGWVIKNYLPLFITKGSMLDNNIKLKILHNDDGSFTDISDECADFGRDTTSLTFLQSTSELYIGYRKPINSFYVELATASTDSNLFVIEYWNGTSWTDTGAVDYTKGFTRSGFITWNRNLTNESKKTINGTELYFIRVTAIEDFSAVLGGIGFLFTDDNDLRQEVPEITDSNHLAGKASHILTHVAVRNKIIQDLRNKNYTHTNSLGEIEDLTVWDILNANQLNQAAIALGLSKIYYNFSDTVGDVYERNSNKYFADYNSSMDLARLSIDSNDDGIENKQEETVRFNVIRIVR